MPSAGVKHSCGCSASAALTVTAHCQHALFAPGTARPRSKHPNNNESDLDAARLVSTSHEAEYNAMCISLNERPAAWSVRGVHQIERLQLHLPSCDNYTQECFYSQTLHITVHHRVSRAGAAKCVPVLKAAAAAVNLNCNFCKLLPKSETKLFCNC